MRFIAAPQLPRVQYAAHLYEPGEYEDAACTILFAGAPQNGHGFSFIFCLHLSSAGPLPPAPYFSDTISSETAYPPFGSEPS